MHSCMMLCTIILYLLLLLLCSYIIIFQTSISISLLRMQMFRPFSQNTTLPSGVLANLSNPELYGLSNTSVIRIPSESGYLGAWYMQPGDSHVACPVTVLYLHGRSQNRGYSHRAGLYKVLLNMGFCVLAMDYRGFGDSSVVEIKEDTVLEDAINAHRYLKRYYKPQKILLWGHSLGAPIAARFAAQDIGQEDGILQYLILESSFDNMEHLVETGSLPGWQKLGIQMVGLERADLAFRCDTYLPKVSYPALILHTEDDHKVGLVLARTLFNVARSLGKEEVALVTLGKELGLDHTGIYQYQGLPALVTGFLARIGMNTGERICRLPDADLCEDV